jgi:hypothetical protein
LHVLLGDPGGLLVVEEEAVPADQGSTAAPRLRTPSKWNTTVLVLPLGAGFGSRIRSSQPSGNLMIFQGGMASSSKLVTGVAERPEKERGLSGGGAAARPSGASSDRTVESSDGA